LRKRLNLTLEIQRLQQRYIRWQMYLSTNYDGNAIHIHYRASKGNSEKIKKMINE
jgi:hypothetical protein